MSGDRLLLHFYSHSKQRSISEKNNKQFLSNLIGSFYRFLFSWNIYTNEIVIILFLISGMIECSALKKFFFSFQINKFVLFCLIQFSWLHDRKEYTTHTDFGRSCESKSNKHTFKQRHNKSYIPLIRLSSHGLFSWNP